MSMNTLDITPTPRILRTLGEIPFQTWQCIAELVDNSIDALLSDTTNEERTITVTWSGESVGVADRTIEIKDNACGMSIEQLQNAVKAGYTSNDPINNLGLFGMGFNIATARMGDETTILSTKSGDTEWVGLLIDFPTLIASKKFDAPIIRVPKENIEESGTRITVAKIKTGILNELANKESSIRQQLEVIYTPLLSEHDINIMVKGKRLRPRNHCVWSESRYVMHNKRSVYAKITIDRSFGSALFDVIRNCYLRPDEAEDYVGKDLPPHIIRREKRLTGWLGIQRYADPNDYGIDFIRNGRKILISNKDFFYYENPYTLQKELQYPVELGGTTGGRIVGELHVDYLIPTYQKNDFDRTDASWEQTREAVCGVGPFLPGKRKAMGFTEDETAPLFVLVNAYRRADAGTKCLAAPNNLAKQYAAEFRKGTRDYLDDTKWWKAAQEEDQKKGLGPKTTEVNSGDSPSDNVDEYFNENEQPDKPKDDDKPKAEQTNVKSEPKEEPETSSLDDLLQRSKQIQQLSGQQYSRTLNVKAYELQKGDIKRDGERKPCYFNSDGIDCDFIYDPKHPLLAQYPITPQMLLLIYLAEKIKSRGAASDIVSIYSALVDDSMKDSRIDRQALVDRASGVFELMREKMAKALRPRAVEVVKCIHESAGEVEEIAANILNINQTLALPFQNLEAEGFDVIEYVPPKTLYRLVDRFPEELFDEKVFSSPYLAFNFADEKSTQRVRETAKERVLSFIKDALNVLSGYGQKVQKDELTRASLSVDFLLREMDA